MCRVSPLHANKALQVKAITPFRMVRIQKTCNIQCTEQEGCEPWLVGMQNGTDASVGNLAVSNKTKYSYSKSTTVPLDMCLRELRPYVHLCYSELLRLTSRQGIDGWANAVWYTCLTTCFPLLKWQMKPQSDVEEPWRHCYYVERQ